MKKCSRCDLEKTLGEFSKKGNGVQPYCKVCMSEIKKAHYKANKENVMGSVLTRKKLLRDQFWDYKQGKSCKDCGESDPIVLEFDHTSDDKFMDVSKMVNSGYSWTRIKAEIDKCDIVCANCHRRRTHKRGGWERPITIQAETIQVII